MQPMKPAEERDMKLAVRIEAGHAEGYDVGRQAGYEAAMLKGTRPATIRATTRASK